MEKEDRDLNKIFAVKDKRQTIPFRSKDLANFLEESSELSLEICKVLEANDIDGETFLNLRRTDLMDLFSFDFKSRKQVADCVEFMKLNGIQVAKSLKDQGLKDKSKSISRSPSEASTESVGSTNPDSEETEVDIIPSSQQFPFVPKRKRSFDSEETEVDIIPSSQQFPFVPKRKRSFDSEDTELVIPTSQQFPVVQKRKMYFDLEDKNFDVATQQPSLISKRKRSIDLKDANVDVKPTGRLLGFQFPITNKVKKCIKGGTALKDEDRRQLIRECVTCLQAKVGEVISNPDFKEASKIICEQIPVLKDAQPPHWPTDMEFPYWSSVLYLLKKRYLNLKSRKPAASTTSHETPKAGLEVEDKDLEDMNKELIKELKPIRSKEKRKGSRDEVNWDNVKRLQTLTFESRFKCIQDTPGNDIVEKVLEKYPFLDVEQCLWNELELHVGNDQPKAITIEDFRKRWSKMALCFTDEDVSNEDICMAALESIHSKFKIQEPLLTFIPEDSTVAGFLESVTTNEPQLVAYHLDDGDSNLNEFQLFLVIDKDILLECQFKIGPDPLITLLASYYAFNLSYKKKTG